ncbi:unnamed protein product [Ectocarpus sp. 12 AP-2014]
MVLSGGRLQHSAVIWLNRQHEAGVLLSARGARHGQCAQQEVRPPAVHEAAVTWYDRQQKAGVLLSAREGEHGQCRRQEVRPSGVHEAAVIWYSRQQKSGVLLSAREGDNGQRIGKRCGRPGCTIHPSYGIHGGQKAEPCHLGKSGRSNEYHTQDNVAEGREATECCREGHEAGEGAMRAEGTRRQAGEEHVPSEGEEGEGQGEGERE